MPGYARELVKAALFLGSLLAAAQPVFDKPARFRAPGVFQAVRREKARYFMRAAAANAPLPAEETRTIDKPGPDSGFFMSAGFAGSLKHLLPQYQAQSRYRYLGRERLDGAECYLLGFAQFPESSTLPAVFVLDGKEHKAFLEGIVWIDMITKRIRRVRTQLLPASEGIAIERFTTDVWVRAGAFRVNGFASVAACPFHARCEL